MLPENNPLYEPRFRVLRRLPWRGFLIFCVIILIIIWMVVSPAGILGKADAVGYAVCHRIGARSFSIDGYQFSVCARCTGQYLGAVLGMVFLAVFRKRRSLSPPWFVIFILIGFLIVYAVDGVNSALHLFPQGSFPWIEKFRLYTPSNTLRLITGIGVGLGLSVMLFPAFNQTVWKRYDFRPVLEGLRDFGLLLILAIILSILVLSENPVVLYPLSLISAGGILMLLTMVYTMVWVMIFRQENKFENSRSLVFPLLAGFAVALTQILLIDAFRYWLTNTWGGFPLG